MHGISQIQAVPGCLGVWLDPARRYMSPGMTLQRIHQEGPPSPSLRLALLPHQPSAIGSLATHEAAAGCTWWGTPASVPAAMLTEAVSGLQGIGAVALLACMAACGPLQPWHQGVRMRQLTRGSGERPYTGSQVPSFSISSQCVLLFARLWTKPRCTTARKLHVMTVP